MRVLLVYHPSKKQARLTSEACLDFFKKNAVACHLLPVDQLHECEQQYDIAIVVGGDGTILQAVHQLEDLQTPVLGINTGKLGFMTDVRLDVIHECLKELLEGKYRIQKRVILKAFLKDEDGTERVYHALNEIVIHRAQNPNLVTLKVSVDASYLTSYCADGLIVATPNGSTAYSLSAGGPIIAPELKALVLTPICPHTLSNRPIVLDSSHAVTVDVESGGKNVDLTVDGFVFAKLSCKSRVTIEKAKRNFHWIALERYDYFQTLREKLLWNGAMPKKDF